ncbi:hypothetical protein NGRA_0590 [Nosema granulosis]|uniref:Uncharacterized protein n=1 Tax=Nosema granulosis TaxID=83296 RepID=A0A9P6H2S1_9MICR|nr:hypothetical protein NGRA_0590 [Nosema granulosis]
MIHQVNLESIEQASKIVKSSDTKLLEYFDKNDRLKNKTDRKSLLKTYKINKDIENELKHLVNLLDNHLPSIDKETAKFREEIAIIGLKNKQQQISLLLHSEQDSSMDNDSDQ